MGRGRGSAAARRRSMDVAGEGVREWGASGKGAGGAAERKRGREGKGRGEG